MSLSFLAEMHSALPEYLTGTSRFQNINKMVTFNAAWKEEAFESLRALMLHMRDIEASDIDFGGPGSNGKIWYRVFGTKAPSGNVPNFEQDEITAILYPILFQKGI